MNKSLKVIFAGTPEFGLPCLEAIKKESFTLQAIYTQPDRPAGRGRALQGSPVKDWARQQNIPVYQPKNFKDPATITELANLKPDIIIVIAYGLILPPEVLQIPKYGCINVHASILPKWRGASPIQHAILHGDSLTGVTIMQMDAGMDTGDYYQIATTSIEANDTSLTMHNKLAELAVSPLINTMLGFNSGKPLTACKQDSSIATYAPKISKQDAIINWQQSAKQIDCQIRAYTPWPLAYTEVAETRVQIIQAKPVTHKHPNKPGTIIEITKTGILIATQQDCLLVEKIKLPGKKAVSIADYMNGNNKLLQKGMCLI